MQQHPRLRIEKHTFFVKEPVLQHNERRTEKLPGEVLKDDYHPLLETSQHCKSVMKIMYYAVGIASNPFT